VFVATTGGTTGGRRGDQQLARRDYSGQTQRERERNEEERRGCRSRWRREDSS
jgi:hypothetical protein